MNRIEKTYLIQNIGVFFIIIGYLGMPISTFLFGALLGFGALFYRWKKFHLQPDILKINLRKPLLLMFFSIICLLISSVNGTNVHLSLDATRSQLNWWRPCFFLMVLFNDRRSFYQAVCGAFTFSLLYILIGAKESLIQFLHGEERYVVGGFLNHNIFAAFINLFLPWSIIYFYIYTHNKIFKIIGLIIILTGIGAVGLSGSRGAIIALVITTFIITLLQRIKWHHIVWCGVILSLLICTVTISKSISQRMFYLPENINSINTLKQEIKAQEIGRFYVWEGAWRMFVDNKLFGVGLYNFNDNYVKRYMPEGAEEPNLEHAHNTFLQRLAETGVVGSMGFWALLLYQFLYLFKYRNFDNGHYIILAGLATFLITFFHGMVDYFFILSPYYRIYWMQWAICYCCGEQSKLQAKMEKEY